MRPYWTTMHKHCITVIVINCSFNIKKIMYFELFYLYYYRSNIPLDLEPKSFIRYLH